MRKLMLTFVFTFMLAVPALAQTYTREEAKGRAEALFDIEGYKDFEIYDNNNYSVVAYDMRWDFEEEGRYTTVTMRSDGNLILYDINGADFPKDKKFTESQCRETAENFIDDVFEGGLNSAKLTGFSDGSTYCEYEYSCVKNGIESISDKISVEVNKFTNKITYYRASDGCFYNYYSFDTNSFEEAKDKIRGGLELGYSTIYDKGADRYNVRLVYAFTDYQLRAENFEPIYTDFDMFTYSDTCMTDDPNKTVPDYFIETDPPENTLSEKKAVKIYNNFYNTDFSVGDIEVNYGVAYGNDDYLVYVNGLIIDSEGRIVGKDNFAEFDENRKYVPLETNPFYEEGMTEEAIAKKVIDKLNVKNYVLTDMRCYDFYTYKKYFCNIVRNGNVSFNERICVSFDDTGDISTIEARYIDDDVFNKKFNVNISNDEAFNMAVEKMEFNPYYYKYYTGSSEVSYEIIKIYGFREGFTINAENGIFYNHDREVIQTGEELLRDNVNVFENIFKNPINFQLSELLLINSKNEFD